MIPRADPRTLFRMVNRKAWPRLFSRWLPYYIVNEFPKSGGTWLAQMLSEALELPFPQHQALRLRPAIVHGHFLNPFGLSNVLVIWRDPRDLTVSYYYHCYFLNEHHNRNLVGFMKKHLPFEDYSDIRSNLPAFLKFLNERPVSPAFTWARFFQSWATRPGVRHTRYEDLRLETVSELIRIVGELAGRALAPERAEQISDRFAFDRAREQAGARVRETGAEMSFVREGSTGGWRRHFTDEAAVLAQRYFGSGMTALGY